MKKKLCATLFAAMLILMLSVSAYAANQVTDISVDVLLYPDGSATVTQVWEGSFSEGTECYFPVTNLGEMTLDALTVSDAGGTYETLSGWKVDASFEEKAGKCGLASVDGGYEVCWGISEYGENLYTVQYQLGGLASSYDDADGFNFQFIPRDMGTFPTDVTVRIQMQDGTLLNADNAGIWGFGFDGQVGFGNGGEVFAYTEQSLSDSDNSVIIMLELTKGLLTPERTVDGSFEKVKKRAIRDSDYGWINNLNVTALTPVLLVVMGGGLLIWFGREEARKIKKLYQQADYYRETPLDGNLEAAHAMAQQFYQSQQDGDIIAATLLKMVSQGCLEPITERDAGVMGREKESVSLRLVNPPAFPGMTAAKLYQLMVSVAGSDGILQEQELADYCTKNYQELLTLVQDAKTDGKQTLVGMGCYPTGSRHYFLANLTAQGKTRLMNLLGFKKYLLDFSLIGERGVSEAIIWQDYLIFAALLGIADQVMEQLKKFYPNVSVYQRQAEDAQYVASRYHRATYETAEHARAEAKRSSGGGGRTSIGGGDGSSGGGSGGGTR